MQSWGRAAADAHTARLALGCVWAGPTEPLFLGKGIRSILRKGRPRLLSPLRSILRIPRKPQELRTDLLLLMLFGLPRKPQELRLRLRESEARGRRPYGEGRHTQ